MSTGDSRPISLQYLEPLRQTTSTRRFPANQTPALHFHALLNEEVPEVELELV
jgi:hypothetical protein